MRAPVLITAALCACVLAACGGDDGDDSAAAPAATTATTPAETAPATTTPPAETAPTPEPLPEGKPSAEDEAQIKAVVKKYSRAMASKDAKTVCSLITEKAQADMVAAFQPVNGAKDCEDAIGGAMGMLNAEGRKKLAAADVDSVKVEGERATAEIGGSGGLTPLVKEDGEWQIALTVS